MRVSAECVLSFSHPSTMSDSELSIYQQIKGKYRKHYIPLESDPEIFTEITCNLGVEGYEFQDIMSLDEEMLSYTLRPIVALIFVGPETKEYEQRENEKEKTRVVYKGKGE